MIQALPTTADADAPLATPSRADLLVILLGASDFPLHSAFHKQTEKNATFGRSCAAVQNLFLELGVLQDHVCNLCDSLLEPKEVLDSVHNFILSRCELAVARGPPVQDVLFYYVGHGVGMKEQYSLVLRGSDSSLLAETSLRFASLVGRIKKTAEEIRRRWGCDLRQSYVIDACLAGRTKYAADPSVVSGAKGRKVEQGGYPFTGVAVLASCNEHEESLTLPGHPYTLFTEALLTAITCPENERAQMREWYGEEDLSLARLRQIMNRWLTQRASAGEELPPTVQTIALDTFAGDIQDVPLLPNPLQRHRPFCRVAIPPVNNAWRLRRRATIAIVSCLALVIVRYGILPSNEPVERPVREQASSEKPAAEVVQWQVSPQPLFADPAKIPQLIKNIPPDRQVKYVLSEHDGSPAILCELPYRERLWRGERVEGVDLSTIPFAWNFPTLSFLLQNQGDRTVVVSEVAITVQKVAVERRPLLIVQDRSVERLRFRNEGWGRFDNVVLRFSLTRQDNTPSVAPYQHEVPLASFEQQCDFPLGEFISDELADAAEIRAVGELDYRLDGEQQKFPFTTNVLLELPGQAAVPPSFAYDVALRSDAVGKTYRVPVAHRLASSGMAEDTDRFLLRVASDKSATYQLAVELRSTNETLGRQPLILEVFVPRSHDWQEQPSHTQE